MTEPLVLVILLGAHSDPSIDGTMMTAARAALGEEAIVLADTSDAKTDDEAITIGERVHARAIAELQWADDDTRTHARLHVRVATNEWADDEIAFFPQDAASEKGRTLGYMLASMVQRLARSAPPTPPPPPPPAHEAGAEAPPPTPKREPASNVDVFAQGNGAIGGGATSVGGAVGLRWWPVARVGFRAAAGARAGRIEEADASTSTLFASVGPGYRVPIGTSLELGARTDFVILQHSVTRKRVAKTTHARWLSAMDAMVEASWSLGPHAGVIAAVGAELAFGTTSVDVGGVPVADIPQARAIGELGLRFRF